ncbi:4-(cytidine 5'-diphospho)-2-C-methyl-D-erythritol kinase [Bauldia sp.]|uniref:4-(cytidine 5'-diphospho)-2-C-methyl-D-erythritol kinase n=1 Tax=Bauldia sp. TaxID=2575872 RepID=UPI003BAD14EB
MAQTAVDPVAVLISEAAAKVESARAKLNLALHVLDRRPDGYHNLDSLVVFADLADRVTLYPEEPGMIGLRIDGPFAEELRAASPPEDNLVFTVAKGMAEAFAADVQGGLGLQLEKHLPIAAGLGGGSADAAAALRLLNRAWHLGIPAQELASIGFSLGADIPVCLLSRPARLRGRGDDLLPVNGLPALPIVLVNPRVPLSTRDVFRRLQPAAREPMPALPNSIATPMELVFWLRRTRNDLFPQAVAIVPPVETALRAVANDPDCVFARMSGSGPTVFGIFMSDETAVRAAARLRAAEPSWWVMATQTAGS